MSESIYQAIDWAISRVNNERRPGRERSIVITKLEEAQLWLSKTQSQNLARVEKEDSNE